MNEPMSTPDSGGRKYRDRSNHDVHLAGESIPCFCWATSGHRLGEEVRTRPEPVPTPDTRQWSIEAEDGTRAYTSEDVALSVAAGYDGFTLGSKRLRVVKSFTRPDPDSEWTPITPDSADDATVGERGDVECVCPTDDYCPKCHPRWHAKWMAEGCRCATSAGGHPCGVCLATAGGSQDFATPPADDANRAPVSGGVPPAADDATVGEQEGCAFGCTTHDCRFPCDAGADPSDDVWNSRTRHWYCPLGNDNCGAHDPATPPAQRLTGVEVDSGCLDDLNGPQIEAMGDEG